MYGPDRRYLISREGQGFAPDVDKTQRIMPLVNRRGSSVFGVHTVELSQSFSLNMDEGGSTVTAASNRQRT